MKQVLFTVLLVSTLGAFVGCGGSNQSQAPTSFATQPQVKPSTVKPGGGPVSP